MSFTHHWFRDMQVEQATFNRIVEDIKVIVPILRRKGIRVDLSPELIYVEGFMFPQTVPEEWTRMFVTMKKGSIHQFCNVNRLWFSIGVECALVIIKHHLNDQIIITSDGDQYYWSSAMGIVQEALGYGENFLISGDKDVPGFDEMNISVTRYIDKPNTEG